MVEERERPPLLRLHDDVIIDAQLELEEKDELKETTVAASCSPAGSANDSREPTPARKIIRFDDGDPAQPNNWSQVRGDMRQSS
jgi:hypothetical protein